MPKKTWYEVQAKGEGKPVEISIFDEIGAWGVSAKAFIADLKAQAGKDILVSINSPGGSVFDALAMYNALRAHGSRITTRVMGVAASAASFLFLAGDTREMPGNTFLMVHHPLTLAAGNAEELRGTADLLDKIAASLIGIYTARTGQGEDDIRAMLDAETWLTAAEAQTHGFATQITAETPITATYDLERLPENIRNIVAQAAKSEGQGEENGEGPAEGQGEGNDQGAGQPAGEGSAQNNATPLAGHGADQGARHLALAIIAKARAAGLAEHADTFLLDAALQTEADIDTALAEAREIIAVCNAARLPDMAGKLIKAHVPLAAVRARLIEARAALDAATPINHHITGQHAAPEAPGAAIWAKIFPPRQTKES